MDSVTQIVLGAAVGEICLGKKLGNRAMLWGAIAGTIPDLDVISNLWLSELDGLVFHRGISHSILFAVMFPFLLSWLVKKYYDHEINNKKYIKLLGTIGGQIVILLGAGICFVLGSLLGMAGTIIGSILGLGAVVWFSAKLYRNYWKGPEEKVNVSYWAWYNFLFWALLTHSILDCFTVYGTQLFAPFSNTRVSWDNIAVADPMYTTPFMLCLIIAGHYNRSSSTRRAWAYAGVIISSLYMAWTFHNKANANEVFESTLADLQVEPIRYMTNPTILNNFMWSGTAETEDSYYQGLYSVFDKEKRFKLIQIPKNHGLIIDNGQDRTLNILKWFSNDYYTLLKRKDGRLQFNDMRYGTFSGQKAEENDFIFRFILREGINGSYLLDQAGGGPPSGSERKIMSDLVTRIKGI